MSLSAMDQISNLNRLLNEAVTQFKLKIDPSMFAAGALGLVPVKNISIAVNIFWKVQVLEIADNNCFVSICTTVLHGSGVPLMPRVA